MSVSQEAFDVDSYRMSAEMLAQFQQARKSTRLSRLEHGMDDVDEALKGIFVALSAIKCVLSENGLVTQERWGMMCEAILAKLEEEA